MLWRGSALASLKTREVAKISDFGRRELCWYKKLPQSPPRGGDSKFNVIACAIIDLESLCYPHKEGAKASKRLHDKMKFENMEKHI